MNRLTIIFLFMTLLLTACGKQSDYPVVQLNAAAPGDVVAADLAPGKTTLRVAVAAVISPKATFDNYSPLLDYLARRLDRPVELIQRPTYAEINELLRTGQADVAFVCGGAFVEGEREQYMELLALPEIQGGITYQALIIVPAVSQAQTLEDLRDQQFAFSDPLSNSGRLYAQYRLAEMGETADTFFKSTIYTYSHDNSIRAVADGIVDGATVDSLVFDALVRHEPELGQKLRVIERSPPFGIPPVVVHPALDEDMKTALSAALLEMHQDEAGQAALAALYVDRFVPPQTAVYDDIRHMAAAIRNWPEQ